jgi:hypothetical protein
MFGQRVVHSNDGVFQHAIFFHRPQTNNTGGGLFRSANHFRQLVSTLFMQNPHHVGPIVHGDLRPMVQSGVDVFVIGFVVFAFDRVSPNAMDFNQSGGHFVLGGKGVRRAQHDVGTTGFQGNGQIRRFRSHMQTSGHPDPFKGLFLFIPFFNQSEDGHFPFRPCDALFSRIGQTNIFDVIFHGLRPRAFLQIGDFIGFFPQEVRVLPAEMTIGGCFSIKRSTELQVIDNAPWSQRKNFPHQIHQL